MKTLFLKLITLTFFTVSAISVNANNDENFALGVITEESLLNDFTSFNDNFQQFTVNEQEQKIIAQWPEALQIDIYFGTWCHDSEREVPKILKLLKANENITATLIALDYQKADPEQLAEAHRIKYTPTIVVYRDASKKEELGRIVERPSKSLVEDINQLLMR